MKNKLKTIVAISIILSLGGILAGFSNEPKSWYFERQKDLNQPPLAQTEIDIKAHNSYYLGDTSQKELYLTFDEGYENGYTEMILDALLEKNVPAAFFVTKSYIKENPKLIARMVKEGHIVGNHTVRHLSSPKLSDQELIAELTQVADYFKEQTGQEMPPFFRPPMGQYSENVLAVACAQGYHTIFWSFAYEDWLEDKQPGAHAAHKRVVDHLHNGAIILLHAVSSSNAQAMGDIIDSAKSLGYQFKSLYELPDIDTDKPFGAWIEGPFGSWIEGGA